MFNGHSLVVAACKGDGARSTGRKRYAECE